MRSTYYCPGITGHVTDDWDRRLLLTYINDFFKEEATSAPFFKLSSLATYYVPKVCASWCVLLFGALQVPLTDFKVGHTAQMLALGFD